MNEKIKKYKELYETLMTVLEAIELYESLKTIFKDVKIINDVDTSNLNTLDNISNKKDVEYVINGNEISKINEMLGDIRRQVNCVEGDDNETPHNQTTANRIYSYLYEIDDILINLKQQK